MVTSDQYQLEQGHEGITGRSRRLGLCLWLGGSIFLVFVMVLVGGATRLTESGLSITEWKPVQGAFPPMSQSAWSAEFELYRQTSQYALLNKGMSLGEFKTIYWWEWGHRQLGRFIGLFYLGGFLLLLAWRALSGKEAVILFGVGLLLALQGFVGWIMVASGLKPGMTAVAPVKLTLHLTLACLFFSALIACLVRFGGYVKSSESKAPRSWAHLFLLLVLIQIGLGGLVAGFDAGLAYNTWPFMDGTLVPSGLFAMEPWWLNSIGNAKAIQFNHRLGAYLLAFFAIIYVFAVLRSERQEEQVFALLLLVGVIVQMMLGILTLINLVPIGLALGHQAAGLVLLALVTWQAARQTKASY